MHFDRLGIEIPRGQVPVLAFAAVRRQLYRGAVCPVEGLVDIQHGLHVVITGRHFAERPDGISGSLRRDDHRLAGGQSLDRRAKNNLRLRCVVDLHSGFRGRICREQEQHPAIERFGGDIRRKADRNLGTKRSEGQKPGHEEEKTTPHTPSLYEQSPRPRLFYPVHTSTHKNRAPVPGTICFAILIPATCSPPNVVSASCSWPSWLPL